MSGSAAGSSFVVGPGAAFAEELAAATALVDDFVAAGAGAAGCCTGGGAALGVASAAESAGRTAGCTRRLPVLAKLALEAI